jgi:acetyl-CoA carboxylase biotin carboxylase subunit
MDRMDRALAEFRVSGAGVHTTIGFLREVLHNPAFAAGEHSTAIVDEILGRLKNEPAEDTPSAVA